jgi:hypothetical protein
MGHKEGDRVLVKVNDNYSYHVVIRTIKKGEDDETLEIGSINSKRLYIRMQQLRRQHRQKPL